MANLLHERLNSCACWAFLLANFTQEENQTIGVSLKALKSVSQTILLSCTRVVTSNIKAMFKSSENYISLAQFSQHTDVSQGLF